jgi:hypothetical protein
MKLNKKKRLIEKKKTKKKNKTKHYFNSALWGGVQLNPFMILR